MLKPCVKCLHFRDGKFHRAYISPRCTRDGDHDAMWYRANVCGIVGRMFELKQIKEAARAA